MSNFRFAANQFVHLRNIKFEMEAFDSVESTLDIACKQLGIFAGKLFARQRRDCYTRAIHDQSAKAECRRSRDLQFARVRDLAPANRTHLRSFERDDGSGAAG
jgi:hypothetical protein